MSGDPEQEYFADGMVEDIITALIAVQVAVRDRPQFELHLQGQARGRAAGRRANWVSLRARRAACAEAGKSAAYHGPAHRAATGAHLWADSSTAPSRHLRPAGQDHRERGRRNRAEDAKSGDRTSAPQAGRKSRCLRSFSSRAIPSQQPRCRRMRIKRLCCWARQSGWNRTMPQFMGSSLGATSSAICGAACTPKRGRLRFATLMPPLRPALTMPWRCNGRFSSLASFSGTMKPRSRLSTGRWH